MGLRDKLKSKFGEGWDYDEMADRLADAALEAGLSIEMPRAKGVKVVQSISFEAEILETVKKEARLIGISISRHVNNLIRKASRMS